MLKKGSLQIPLSCTSKHRTQSTPRLAPSCHIPLQGAALSDSGQLTLTALPMVKRTCKLKGFALAVLTSSPTDLKIKGSFIRCFGRIIWFLKEGENNPMRCHAHEFIWSVIQTAAGPEKHRNAFRTFPWNKSIFSNKLFILMNQSCNSFICFRIFICFQLFWFTCFNYLFSLCFFCSR